ncbi:hypothetical protein TREES_T100017150 [Tupaia chinensis]|uniref:Uncharacterized protein n=1 Tax=Tupaia chinensis TaxID=246437 RepID=L9KH58_TUPCH|nr:hypothetical protein TREES_T100017150 [Tupaia chinensis]
MGPVLSEVAFCSGLQTDDFQGWVLGETFTLCPEDKVVEAGREREPEPQGSLSVVTFGDGAQEQPRPLGFPGPESSDFMLPPATGHDAALRMLPSGYVPHSLGNSDDHG